MELHLFNISNFKVDGGAMFGVIPKYCGRVFILWMKTTLLFLHSDRLLQKRMEFNPGRCGMGDKQDEKFSGICIFTGRGIGRGP